jgi:hypothetical protein
MLARHHQRRREKKLMTVDQVNERFPVSKYKNWVAAKANEGLSTNGGVAAMAPRSGTASLREPDAIPPSSAADAEHPVGSGSDGASQAEVTTTEDFGETAGELKSIEATTAENRAAPPIVEEYYSLKEVQTTDSTVDKQDTPVGGDEDEDDDEDEHIHPTVAPELLANPGDSCAICIGTLEQDHDIRGLTCGHTFHVRFLDPWLTTCRACRPLCKADYCVPNPCPEGEAVEPGRPGRLISSGYPGDGVNYSQRESRREMRELRATAVTTEDGAAPDPASVHQSDTAARRRWRP